MLSNLEKNTWVIIITYNGESWIKECLVSILKGTITPQILVVDNGSKDATLSIVSEFSKVVIIENDRNIGFGKANNQGLKYAIEGGADYCFLLNQDAYVKDDTIEKLIHSFDTNRYGLISPIHLNGDGSRLDEGFRRFMKWRKSSGFFKAYESNNFEQEIYNVDFVNAAAWMLSRECIMKVGLFHPLFQHYGEDDNFIHRIQNIGLRVSVHSGTSIRHDRDGKLGNKLRSDCKKKFTRILLIRLLNPNRSYSFLQLFGNLLITRGRWSYLPDFTFYKWGTKEIISQRKIVNSFKESLNPWND